MKTARQLIALVALLFTAASALQASTSSNANLRAAPSITAGVVTVIPKATALNVGNCTTWCAVSYGGQSGYISKTTLTFKTATVPASLPPTSGMYTNVDGQQIQRPVMSDTAPAGASAHCRDGSYSFSTHRSGTCSHHGGVEQWL